MKTAFPRSEHVPPEVGLIEVRVPDLPHLFNTMDPSPFRQRDLDPAAEEFIVSWSKDLPPRATLSLTVHLDEVRGPADQTSELGDAVHEYFGRRSAATRRRLKDLFRRGRSSLGIGLAFLAASIGVGDLLGALIPNSRLVGLGQESLLIGGWVAMWGPLEIFLYDWWPIRAEARLFDRLAAMPVRIQHKA